MTMLPHSTARPPKTKGFTLVELLVVMGIVVLLAGIAIPVLMRAYGRADRSRLSFQLQTLSSALDAYRSDFGDYPTTSNVVISGSNSIFTKQINDAGLRGARTLQKALMGFGPAGNPTFAYAGQSGITTGDLPDSHIAGQDGAGVENSGSDAGRFAEPGFGFRVNAGVQSIGPNGAPVQLGTGEERLTGRVYGPYLNVDAFRVGYARNNPAGTIETAQWTSVGSSVGAEFSFNGYVILDATDRPVLYYPALNPRVNVNQGQNFLARESGTDPDDDTIAMYRVTDNSAWVDATTNNDNPAFQFAMGDRNNNGRIDSGETAAITGSYVLWLSGPDTRFFSLAGVTGDAARKTELEKMDDVTSFRP
jgi:general secretion pathway protein G